MDAVQLRAPGQQDLPGGRASPKVSDDEGEGKRRSHLLCAACAHRITASDQAIEIDGSHHHTFFNPAGVVFEIGCFASAMGCVVSGVPTTEFSWFPSHAWSYANCRGCGTHLGWAFQGASGGAFFGLVLNRLGESEEPD